MQGKRQAATEAAAHDNRDDYTTRELTVHIMPKGKERPRFTKSGHAYTSPAQFEHEHAIRKEWVARYGIEPPVGKDVPVSLVVRFHKPLPKSVRAEVREWTQKPDVDNLLKSVSDALVGYAYPDDAQIVTTYGEKMPQVHGAEPRIEIQIIYGKENGR